MAAKVKWTRQAVEALGVRTDVPTAGSIIAGLGRDESYRAVKRGQFPVPVIRVGHRLVVPVQPILDLLCLDTATAGASPKAPAATSALTPAAENGSRHDDTSPSRR